jgi:hypothetical protein
MNDFNPSPARLFARVPVTVSAEDFVGIIESNGCSAWADDLQLTKAGARFRQWKDTADPDVFTYTWHTVTPHKIARTIVGLFTGKFTEAQCPAWVADEIRNLWQAPHPDACIDSEAAGNLIQLVCFGEIVYG